MHALTLVLGLALSTTAFAQGADDCASAQAISGEGSWAVDTSAATTDGVPECADTLNDVWFDWTAGQDGPAIFDLCAAADFDTVIVVYGAGCPTGAPLACNDDTCNLRSRVSISVVTGNVYKVRVGGWNAAAIGTATLTVAYAGDDLCSNPTVISGEGSWPFDTLTATTDGVPECAPAYNDIWYEWEAPATDGYSIHTCIGATFDTVLVAYDLGCPAGAPIACNDDTCGTLAAITVNAIAGQKYLIRLGSFGPSQAGTGTLEIVQGGVPGGCSTPSVGPDIWLGQLSGISTWGFEGAYSGYSIGTTACNVGDTELAWEAASNQHPVIAQNMFKLENGRFEQIGQSWLKHGFGSATGSLCCTCIDPGNGQIIGVGCSDPYGSSTNGTQIFLGPRSEVNPFTGDFAMPYTDQGGTGNAIYKRIQVLTADLDPALHPTATYYGAAQYVSPGEAAAGNHYDNAAWIDIEVQGFSAGTWNLDVDGITHSGEAPIYAWRDADPLVQVEPVFVPGEGLFHVASRVTDNGNGTWHYEYAVYNENSDLACGSFSVPTEVGTTVSGLGFTDTDRHSGELVNSTDWVRAVNANEVRWDTDSFLINPTANALTYATLFNFRFDADVAPVSGQVELGMFKTGGPTSITSAAQVPGPSDDLAIVCSPANDHVGGVDAKLNASSFGSGVGSDLHIECTDGPAGEFGFLLVSGTVGTGVNVFSGVLCLVNPSGRYNGQIALNQGLPQLDSISVFDGAGVAQNISGTSLVGSGFDVPLELPFSPPGQSIASGETWAFQFWFRDTVTIPGDSANFSNGLSVTFP